MTGQSSGSVRNYFWPLKKKSFAFLPTPATQILSPQLFLLSFSPVVTNTMIGIPFSFPRLSLPSDVKWLLSLVGLVLKLFLSLLPTRQSLNNPAWSFYSPQDSTFLFSLKDILIIILY